jgi:hypothetical protein
MNLDSCLEEISLGKVAGNQLLLVSTVHSKDIIAMNHDLREGTLLDAYQDGS